MTRVFIQQNTSLVNKTVERLRNVCIDTKQGNNKVIDLVACFRNKLGNNQNQDGSAINGTPANQNKDGSAIESTSANQNFKKAAVLIPIVIDDVGNLNVLLTVRNSAVSLYPYEVSLPGGKVDKQDRCFIETALRESEEEIGLDRNNVEIIAQFPSIPVSRRRKYDIYPVLGVIRNSFYAKLNKNEVLDIFHVPLTSFLEEPQIGRSKVPHVKTKGVVTNLSVQVFGATFAALSLCAISVYNKLPHEYAIPYLSFMTSSPRKPLPKMFKL